MESELRDWTDLLEALDRYEIEYLIVGGIAVSYHAEPRYTKDLDVLISVTPGNYLRLYDALREFGAPLHLVAADEFLSEDFVFFIGNPPWRIDLLTSIPGVDFAPAYADRVRLPFGGITANFISKEWLIRAKRASNRHQDLADLEALEAFE